MFLRSNFPIGNQNLFTPQIVETQMSSTLRSLAQLPSPYFVSPVGTVGNATAGGAIGFIPSALPIYLTGATVVGSTYTFPTYAAMITGLNNLVNNWVWDYTTGAGEILKDMGKQITITYVGQTTPAITMRLMQVTQAGGATDSNPVTFSAYDTFYFTTASNNATKIQSSIVALGGGSNGNIASVRLIRS